MMQVQTMGLAHLRKMKNKIANKNKKRYKLKTHSGAKKRFRFTASGLIKRGHTGKRHNMYCKSKGRGRRLSRTGYVHKTLLSQFRKLMPYH
jgi:large subunit ribosomal protein L35